MSDALTMLAEIPGLAAEAFATWGTPNPGEESERTRRPAPGSRPPADLHRLVALSVPGEDDPDQHDRGDGRLMLELLLAVRMVAEEWPDTVPDWPSHDWVSVCRWLNQTANLWRFNQFAAEWVADSTTRAWRGLRELCRVPRETVLVCTELGCGERARVDGDWMICEAGHDVPRKVAMRRQLGSHPHMTAEQIARQRWGVPEWQLRRWKRQGLIQPVGKTKPAKGGRPADLWDTWTVVALRHAGAAVAG